MISSILSKHVDSENVTGLERYEFNCNGLTTVSDKGYFWSWYGPLATTTSLPRILVHDTRHKALGQSIPGMVHREVPRIFGVLGPMTPQSSRGTRARGDKYRSKLPKTTLTEYHGNRDRRRWFIVVHMAFPSQPAPNEKERSHVFPFTPVPPCPLRMIPAPSRRRVAAWCHRP